MNNYQKICGFIESIRPIVAKHVLEYRTRGPLKAVTDGELTIIEIIGSAERITMGEIAARTGVTKPTVTAHTDKLEKKGMVKRRRSREDRRIIWLILTTKGKDLYKKNRRMHDTIAHAVANCLSPQETDYLIKIMGKVYKTFSKHGHVFE